ncbi:MAG: phosphoribosylaminoimidazole carboxylase [Desulfobacteraceae bacterium]|jgi:cupin 2 domain-containing protein
MISNLFTDIPETLPDEFFEEILTHSNVRIERIVSRGHRSPEGFWYDQDWDEWILLVQGSAGLAFEGASAVVELIAGDHLLIQARKRHRVAWTAENEDTIWLAVHLVD